MKSRISFYTCVLVILVVFFSGVISLAEASFCGFERHHQRLMESDPDYRHAVEEQESLIRKRMSGKVPRSPMTVYSIPVVVHVIHLGESEGTGNNISLEQIQDGIRVINEDFRKITGTNGDGNGVDTQIEFCLAQRDPSDQPTTGVLRIDASSIPDYANYGVRDDTTLGVDESVIKDLSRWDPDRFYNIWLVTEIDNNNGESGTTGWAYFPGASSDMDGAIIVNKSFGTIGSAAGGLGRTVTHELGHAFGLYHTFEGDDGGTNCPQNIDCTTDGDQICDTPPHIRSDSDCREGESNACVTGTLLDEVIHNYMDYSSDACQNEYTTDQRIRMRTVLDAGGLRASLAASDGCTPVTPPISDFTARTGAYPGQIRFTDLSTNGPTSWQWSFPGGDPSGSTLQHPVITYATPGTYTVTLTATNSVGTGTTEIKTDYLQILPLKAVPYTTSDGGNMETDSGDFTAEIVSGSTNLWERGIPSNAIDYAASGDYIWKTDLDADIPKEALTCALYTPAYDFSGPGTYEVRLKYRMEIFYNNAPGAAWMEYSTDNGYTWQRLGSNTGNPAGTQNWYNKGDHDAIPDGICWWDNWFFWTQGIYNASALAGQTSVQFRILYRIESNWVGTEGYAIDGFGVDDFEIGYTASVTEAMISGNVSDGRGTGIPGVSLTFSNSGGTASTDGAGNYFQMVSAGWSGTVTPAKGGYYFEPSAQTYTNVTADLIDQDYLGTALDLSDVIKILLTTSGGFVSGLHQGMDVDGDGYVGIPDAVAILQYVAGIR